jgi:hypothetical protein
VEGMIAVSRALHSPDVSLTTFSFTCGDPP